MRSLEDAHAKTKAAVAEERAQRKESLGLERWVAEIKLRAVLRIGER